MTVKIFNKKLIGLLIISQLGFCASGRTNETTRPGSKTDDKSKEATNKANEIIEKYFLMEPVENEAFRVYVSSDDYTVKQTGFSKLIDLVTDTSGRNPMAEEIKAYDMVELFTEGVYKVELYKESGLIAHIRPVKPAHISEINKIIADDITRFKFKFKDPDKPEPLTFKIRYGIRLQKKKTQEEIKKILKDNVHE
jgi:hypothetical protein